MVNKRLGKCMRMALNTLASSHKPLRWTEFASITIPGTKKPLRQHTVNVTRHLKRAGYIEDMTREWRANNPDDTCPFTVYRLTKLGVRAAMSGLRETA